MNCAHPSDERILVPSRLGPMLEDEHGVHAKVLERVVRCTSCGQEWSRDDAPSD